MFNNMTNSPWSTNAMNFRLTPISGAPIVDNSGGPVGTIYVTPYGGGDLISIYDLNVWKKMQVINIGITVPAVANTVYDVFAEDAGAGVVAYTTVAWTSLTVRAVDVSLFNGVYTKTADKTKTYVGSFRTRTASQVSFSPLLRDIWCAYNRVEMPIYVTDSTNSWTLGASPINTYRQANASAANQISILQGMLDDPIKVRASVLFSDTILCTTIPGIGIDSTTTSSANIKSTQQNSANILCSSSCEYRGFLALPGSHDIVWLEASSSATSNFYGDNNAPDFFQSGMKGSIAC